MECCIPKGYETVEHEGEILHASYEGRGEVEIEPGVDGERPVYVQYHGIMKKFEPERSPPRPIVEWGSISGMCRAFMSGDRREFTDLLTDVMTQPIRFEGGVSAKSFTHSRNKVQEAVLSHLNLAAVVANDRTVSGSKYRRLVLVNPSVSAINFMYTQQGIRDYDVIFRPSVDEQDSEELYEGFLAYIGKIRVVLDEISYIGQELDKDYESDEDLFFCGFNCEYWQDYKNTLTIELSPNAYVATGRKFHVLEEDDDAIRYTNFLYSEENQRYVSGVYSRKCPLYRYTPDQLEKFFSNVYDVTHWGMHGVLTTIRVNEWSYQASNQVPVVRGACMLGARALLSSSVTSARKIVSRMSKQKVGDLDLTDEAPYLNDDIGLYNTCRFYVFDHMRIVLDTGKRVHFKEDPKGKITFMGSNFSPGTSEDNGLVLRRDQRGHFKYKGDSYTVVWHSSMYHMSGKKTMVMMPQTSIVRYVTGSRMFANDRLFDDISDGAFEILKI